MQIFNKTINKIQTAVHIPSRHIPGDDGLKNATAMFLTTFISKCLLLLVIVDLTKYVDDLITNKIYTV